MRFFLAVLSSRPFLESLCFISVRLGAHTDIPGLDSIRLMTVNYFAGDVDLAAFDFIVDEGGCVQESLFDMVGGFGRSLHEEQSVVLGALDTFRCAHFAPR